jgi:hypothetical protein
MSAVEVIEGIRALSATERERVFESLIADPELREDLQDSLTLAARRDEPSRPLDEVLRGLRLVP